MPDRCCEWSRNPVTNTSRMVQTTLAGFLSPPSRRPESQSSLLTPPPGQSSPRRHGHSTPNGANRGKKKSKRVLKNERKRERKRAKLLRACKKNVTIETSSPTTGQITPMPSPCHNVDFDPQNCPCDNNDGALITDQSLTDLLAATDVTNFSNDSSNSNNSLPESNDQMILRLEAKLLATNIELQAEINEKNSLQNQVDILMAEMDSLKKIDKNQKNQLKKLMNENDKLRKEISRVSGIRRYTERNSDTLNSAQCDISIQTDNVGDLCDKYTALKSKLVGITDSLLTALDDNDAEGFTVISRNTRPSSLCTQPSVGQSEVQSAATSQHLSANQVVTQSVQPQPQPQPQPRPRSSQPQSEPWRPTPAPRLHVRRPQTQQQPPTQQQPQPRRIPVVEIGAAARNVAGAANNARQGLYSNPSVNYANDSSDTIIIGSSLVSGLGPKLCSMGINATSFMYRGADIPTIQSRVRDIVKPGTNPKHIVLQVAGNDATKHESRRVLAHYESLIRDISSRCPDASIILCKVPPRKGTAKTISTINEINTHLDVFAERLHNVSSVDICSRSVHHFRKDGTHFNGLGLDHYAHQLAGILRNFHQVHSVTRS